MADPVLFFHGKLCGSTTIFRKIKDRVIAKAILPFFLVADAAFFGHIHVPVVEKEAGVLLVNPGSLAYPRQRGRRPSYAVMETDGKGEMHVEIRYL